MVLKIDPETGEEVCQSSHKQSAPPWDGPQPPLPDAKPDMRRIHPPRDKGRPLPDQPATISALELVKKYFDPIRWAIPGLLPAGVTLLVGAPKTGKSWLVLDFAIANASGGPVLGSIQVDPGNVLYLALEDNQRRLKTRLEKRLKGAAAPDGFHFATEWPRIGSGAVECIEDHITRHPDTRLIIIDTLAKIRPRTKGRENPYEQDYAVGAPLLQLAGKHGIAIVLVHHTRKLESDDPLDMVSGSTGLTGGVDNVLVLKRVRGTDVATLFVTGRDLEHETTYELNWDCQLAAWAISGQGPHVGLSPERRRVFDVIVEHGPVSGKTISSILNPGVVIKRVGKEWASVRKLLPSLIEKGVIYKGEDGLYNSTHSTQGTHHTHSTQGTHPYLEGDCVPCVPLDGNKGYTLQPTDYAASSECVRCVPCSPESDSTHHDTGELDIIEGVL